MRDQLNCTSIVVTHDTRSMRRVGNHVMMLHHGVIHANGKPDEIFNSTDPIVHKFVNGIADPKDLSFDMNKIKWKVGLFIAISLVVAVALVLNFAKGISPLTKTYSLNLTTKNVDGIVRNAVVMMSGVPIGNVSKIKLNTDKSEVTITILIEEEFKIREGSKFHIETAGFLGDKYIGIIPTRNQDAPMLPTAQLSPRGIVRPDEGRPLDLWCG